MRNEDDNIIPIITPVETLSKGDSRKVRSSEIDSELDISELLHFIRIDPKFKQKILNHMETLRLLFPEAQRDYRKYVSESPLKNPTGIPDLDEYVDFLLKNPRAREFELKRYRAHKRTITIKRS